MRSVISFRRLFPMLLGVGLLVLPLPVAATPNPVLSGVDSSGALRFGGAYYVLSDTGILFSSDNLIEWQPGIKPFNMQNHWSRGLTSDDIASYDLHYHDGAFHLYWCMGDSEELSDSRAIGHAVGQEIVGPYNEPARNLPFDRRFDPHFFLDDDGACYFYKVRVSPEQDIWGEHMQNPWLLSGYNEVLLRSRQAPGSPIGTRDVEPAGSPWVLKHHGQYYLLYSVPSGGLRAAQTDQPLAFTANKRYPGKVFEDDIVEMEPDSATGDDEAPEDTETTEVAEACGDDAPIASPQFGQGSVSGVKRPRVLRGPNGFEWWLLYTASFNGESTPSLGIQRAHFFGRRLVIEGPTTAHSDGYLPVPALPSFRDDFDIGAYLQMDWEQPRGQWRLEDGLVKQQVKSQICAAILKESDSREYLFETAFRILEGTSGQAGVIVWRRNEKNEIRVAFDRAQRDWVLSLMINGREQMRPLHLGLSTNPDGWRTVRVENNGAILAVILDGKRVTLDVVPNTLGTTGLFTREAIAAFAPANYTRGWEEYGKAINGWEDDVSEEASRGEQRITEDGIQLLPVDGGRAHAFKGKALESYEFAVQLLPGTSSSGPVRSGAYAVWADADNYLEAAIDAVAQQLIVSGVRDGKKLKEETASMPEPSPRWNPSPTLNGRHLRVLYREDRVLMYVDGEQMNTAEGACPASRAGLFTEGAMCRFDGISRFERGRDKQPEKAIKEVEEEEEEAPASS